MRPVAAARKLVLVPRYEYRCRACGDTFELSRPMAESSAPCTCPQGHDDTVKLLSTVSVGGLASARGSSAGPAAAGGGCCGGACGCG
jgi:putative FmdB family regulatory protein